MSNYKPMQFNDIMREYCKLTLVLKNHTKVNGYYYYIQDDNLCNGDIKAKVLVHGNDLPNYVTLSELLDLSEVEQIEIDGIVIY